VGRGSILSAFDFFDKIYVVHLPNAERREKIQEQLDTIGRKAEFIHATKPQFAPANTRRNHPAEFGVSLSHIKAIVKAISDGAERPLFLEDDIVFEDYPRVDELPEFWSLLYLGGHPREKVSRYSEHLVKVGRFSFAEAYAVNRHSLFGIVDHWCNRVGRRDAAFDLVLGEFASFSMGFCCHPIVTRQVTGISQVSGCKDEKAHLLVKGWAQNLA
jgi:hypothetical protein